MTKLAVNDATRWLESQQGFGRVMKCRSGGGSAWSSVHVLEMDTGQKLFLKTCDKGNAGYEMFRGESLGLKAMYHTQSLRIPKVYHVDTSAEGTCAYILMEYLEFGGKSSQEEFGRMLARMHRAEPEAEEARSGLFGFPVNNTIGGTPQINHWMDDWVDFFRTQRLHYQLRLAQDTELSRLGDVLCSNLEDYFQGIDVKPSTLHGDLWSGNIASCDGKPSVFDPACYYGHHEAEFGMSWCAGFSNAFWHGYRDIIAKVSLHGKQVWPGIFGKRKGKR